MKKNQNEFGCNEICNENRKIRMNQKHAYAYAYAYAAMVAAQPVCPAHPFVFMLRNFLQRHNDCRNPAGQPTPAVWWSATARENSGSYR